MNNKRFTEPQIFALLKEGESAAISVSDLCQQHGVNQSTYYKWKLEFDRKAASYLAKLKALENENSKLKKMFADVSLQNVALKEIIAKTKKPSEHKLNAHIEEI